MSKSSKRFRVVPEPESTLGDGNTDVAIPLLPEVQAIVDLVRQTEPVGPASPEVLARWKRLAWLATFRRRGNSSAAELVARHSAGSSPAREALPQAADIPPEIEGIEDATLRQAAREVWVSASRLRGLCDRWQAWFENLKFHGHMADPGLALRISEATETCVRALCRHDLHSPSFRAEALATTFSGFPAPPNSILQPISWWDDAEYFWANYKASLGLTPLVGELWTLMNDLRVAPSVVFHGAGTDRSRPPAKSTKAGKPLTPCQKWILEELQKEGSRIKKREMMTRGHLAEHGPSTVAMGLSHLVKIGLLRSETTDPKDGKGKGYGFPSWHDPLIS